MYILWASTHSHMYFMYITYMYVAYILRIYIHTYRVARTQRTKMSYISQRSDASTWRDRNVHKDTSTNMHPVLYDDDYYHYYCDEY